LEIIKLLKNNMDPILKVFPEFKNIAFYTNWFNTGKLLGKGSYAEVYLGRNCQSGQICALKVQKWTELLAKGGTKLKKQLANEIEIMKNLRDRHVVALYDFEVVADSNRNLLVLALEYCSGGDMDEYMKQVGPAGMKEDDAIHWCKQLKDGLKFLRDQGIIHRDLKPGNLLLSTGDRDDAVLKITDFTFARYIQPNDLATTLVGTPLYMAPEIFQDRQYTDKGDLWSVGVIMYQMLTGKVPYNGNDLHDLVSNVRKNNLTWNTKNTISNEMKLLVEKLMEKDPTKRINWSDFFLHPILNKVQFSNENKLQEKDKKKSRN